ncbi:C39 family peptidase [Candidatus Saccharibacteria bacterium]|nr:C39 family peptidase [Candidatus Saccharibacteria bacterium]
MSKNKNKQKNKKYQNNQTDQQILKPNKADLPSSITLIYLGLLGLIRYGSRRLGLALLGLTLLQVGLLALIIGVNVWNYQSQDLALRPIEPKLEIGQSLRLQTNLGVEKEFEVEVEPSFDYRIELVNSGSLGLIKQIELVPESRLQTGTDYQIRLKGVAKKFSEKQNLKIGFRTQDAPEIQGTNFDQAQNIKIDQELTLALTDPNNDLSNFQIKTSPAIEFDKYLSEDQTKVNFQPKSNYQQSTNYQVEVFDYYKDQQNPIKTYQFETVRKPVLSINQAENIIPGSNVVVSFSEPMQTSQVGIQTSFAGYNWLDPFNLSFDTSGISPGSSYEIEVLAGARTEAGGVLEADSVRSFRVRSVGAVYASISPGGYGVSTGSKFRVDFSQAVDRASAEARISVAPSFDYHLEWISDQTVLVVPNSSLAYSTEYRVVIEIGVVNVGFGLPSSSGFTGSFVTEERVTILGVPLFYQTMPLSCESAALKMALAYRGINTTENHIMSLMGYNPRHWQENGNQWDDPYQMFVGDVYGSQVTKTGYGVYAPPVARAAQLMGANASVHYGVSASFIANQIANNNPVVIWGYSYSGQRMDWNVNGSSVGAYIGEHVRTVIGFRGNPDNPTSFIINDPISGQLNWTAAQLMANMNIHGNLSNQAVVVY